MKNSLWLMSAAFACVLVFSGCRAGEEAAKSSQADKVKEAVKDVVTQDFKHLETAKKSLAESAQKGRAELNQIDKELK